MAKHLPRPQLSEADKPDRLIDFRQVGALVGSNCKTGHTARNLARRGQIKAVTINSRVIRYSEASVRALVAGLIDPVAACRRSSPATVSP